MLKLLTLSILLCALLQVTYVAAGEASADRNETSSEQPTTGEDGVKKNRNETFSQIFFRKENDYMYVKPMRT